MVPLIYRRCREVVRLRLLEATGGLVHNVDRGLGESNKGIHPLDGSRGHQTSGFRKVLGYLELRSDYHRNGFGKIQILLPRERFEFILLFVTQRLESRPTPSSLTTSQRFSTWPSPTSHRPLRLASLQSQRPSLQGSSPDSRTHSSQVCVFHFKSQVITDEVYTYLHSLNAALTLYSSHLCCNRCMHLDPKSRGSAQELLVDPAMKGVRGRRHGQGLNRSRRPSTGTSSSTLQA